MANIGSGLGGSPTCLPTYTEMQPLAGHGISP